MTDYITVSQLADYLTITDADDDVALAAAIASATTSINQWCGRDFRADTVATARRFLCDSQCVHDVDDFWDLATLVVKTDQGNVGTYDLTWTITTHFEVYPFNGVVNGSTGWPYNKIEATGVRWFPTGQRGHRPRVQVTAKWGWAAVPDAVTQACYIKAARIFRRKDSPEGAGGFDTGGGGFAVPLIRPVTRMDPDLADLLAPYRRLERFA